MKNIFDELKRRNVLCVAAEATFDELKEKYSEQYRTETAGVCTYLGKIDSAFEWLDVRRQVGGPGS